VREALSSHSFNHLFLWGRHGIMNQQSLIDHSPGNILFKAFRIYVFLFLVLIILPVFFGCGTLSNGRGWGKDATLTPGWNRIKESAVNAASSPETWIPVAISVGLMIDEADERISDWASNNNLLFGSQENAANWSNYLAYGSGAAYLITTMATPSGDNPSDWLEAKAKGLLIGAAASGITAGSTELIKDISGRPRPGGTDYKSFPSSHASGSAALSTLARRNLKSFLLSPGIRLLADIGITATAFGTGWARVEAKKHNPSDVLVGYALGHFFSAFINDAFLGLDHENAPLLNIEESDIGILISLNWSF
jgi:hypothetical protein